jgi:four helix bundle protein
MSFDKESKQIAGNNEFVKDYEDLRVFQGAMDAAMRIFDITKTFPAEEKYSLVDQIRRSSRSVRRQYRGSMEEKKIQKSIYF